MLNLSEFKPRFELQLKWRFVKIYSFEALPNNPYQYPPEYEFLKGDMDGLISRRINKQHRIVYEVIEHQKLIKIYRMWTHYE
ncbi:MAG: Txe/YoeB family addiction module toxin [Methylococcaceae bacterium]